MSLLEPLFNPPNRDFQASVEQRAHERGIYRSLEMKITLEMIKTKIIDEYYFTAFDGAVGSPRNSMSISDKHNLETLTFCVLVLDNGFLVTGESKPISPDNFNPEIGKDVARRKAVEKLWELMGYTVREDRARAESQVQE